MTPNEIAEIVLQFIEVLTRWQLVVLYIVLILRKPIASAIPVLMSALANRVTRISGPGFSIDLASLAYKFEPELIGEILRKIPATPVDTEDVDGAEELQEESETDREGETRQSEIDELEQTLSDIENR